MSHFSHIDERGFQFDNIEIDRINFFNGEYEDLYPYIDDGGRTIHFSDRTNILTFLYLLTHIKQNYEKSYHLEYLLDFPNVDRVSNFSTIVRFEIWESIIDFVKRTLLEDFTDKYLDFIDYLFETTWLLDINPGSSDVYSLMKFILENKNRINDNNLNSIMRILQRIDANVDRIDNNLDTAKNEINQKLDNISDGLAETKKILFDFKNMFAEYQKDISEKLSNPLLDEISREKLINDFSNSVVTKITDKMFQDKIKDDLQKEMVYLKTIFDDNWNKLSEKSQIFLATARVMFIQMSSISDLTDYSGVCILVSKAVEEELHKRFYRGFVDYLKNNYPFPQKAKEWHSELYRLNGYGRYSIIPAHEFTLGSFPFICYKRGRNVTDEQFQINQKRLMEYCRNRLFVSEYSETQIEDGLMYISNKSEEIKNQFRNPSAHLNELQYIDAKRCIETVIEVEKILKKILMMFKQ